MQSTLKNKNKILCLIITKSLKKNEILGKDVLTPVSGGFNFKGVVLNECSTVLFSFYFLVLSFTK